jgi:hypothetical protein
MRHLPGNVEIKMLMHRLFNLLIAIAIVVAVVLTVREAVATTAITSQRDSIAKCDSLPSLTSIRTEYRKEADRWVVRWENGPAGVDGGLPELLSNKRSCSSIKEK